MGGEWEVKGGDRMKEVECEMGEEIEGIGVGEGYRLLWE